MEMLERRETAFLSWDQPPFVPDLWRVVDSWNECEGEVRSLVVSQAGARPGTIEYILQVTGSYRDGDLWLVHRKSCMSFHRLYRMVDNRLEPITYDTGPRVQCLEHWFFDQSTGDLAFSVDVPGMSSAFVKLSPRHDRSWYFSVLRENYDPERLLSLLAGKANLPDSPLLVGSLARALCAVKGEVEGTKERERQALAERDAAVEAVCAIGTDLGEALQRQVGKPLTALIGSSSSETRGHAEALVQQGISFYTELMKVCPKLEPLTDAHLEPEPPRTRGKRKETTPA